VLTEERDDAAPRGARKVPVAPLWGAGLVAWGRGVMTTVGEVDPSAPSDVNVVKDEGVVGPVETSP